ncbi:MAG: T9SS type A sorting domain-containing protein [Chitinophagales bacterium]
MKPITFFSLLFLSSNSLVNAQAIIEWDILVSGDSKDELYSLHQTADDGIILGGHSWSGISGDKTEESRGLSDYWIVKLDPLGNVQWDKTFGGDSVETLRNLYETPDGGYIIGGHTLSGASGDKTEESKGMSDFWIIKINAAGEIDWQKTIGGTGNDLLYDIRTTPDGGYIVGGWSDSDISGDKTENSIGLYDYWVLKLDAIGNIEWQNTIGGYADDQLNTVISTPDGGYLLGGESRSHISGDKTEDNISLSTIWFDFWILKLDASGNIEWQNTIGTTANDRLNSVVFVSSGGYMLGGYSDYGIQDEYYVVKTDDTGNIVWEKLIGGSGADQLKTIEEISDHFYILGGSSNSGVSGDKTEPNLGSDDYWVVKIDSAGNVLWDKTLGSDRPDELFSIDNPAPGKYILGGDMQTSTGVNSKDYWIVKLSEDYNQATGTVFIDLNENSVQEISEPVLQNNLIIKEGTDDVYFTRSNGFYVVDVANPGTYIISPSHLNYYAPVPVNYNLFFAGVNEISENNDFAFIADGSYNDLCVSLSSCGLFRPGFESTYTIYYENVGTTTLDATIIFLPDELLSYVNSTPAPDFSAVDSLVWYIGSLDPYESGSISVTVLVSVSADVGAGIHSLAIIEPIAGDADASCNYSSWNDEVVASFDPNNILVNKPTVFDVNVTDALTLDYIINFQNTGTFYAEFIRLHDTLPVELNAMTLEILESSHPLTAVDYYADTRLLKFSFDEIFLPDSNTNEPGSHGFVRYRIKPVNSLIAGDEIKNTAHIYFDYNPPVITNTALTKIISPVDAIQEPGKVETVVTVSPNPFSQETNITMSEVLQKAKLKVYDMYGKESIEISFSGNNVVLGKGTLSPGTYFFHIEADGNRYAGGKLIVL